MMIRKTLFPTLALSALLLAMVLHTSTLRGSHRSDQIELEFTKWTLAGGVIAGRLENATGTFGGAILSFAPPEDNPPVNPMAQIEARYDITFDGKQFSALIDGHQNNKSHTGVLNGVITDGWQAGSNVHVEFAVVDQGTARTVCPRRFCFVGSIRIMPNS